MTSCSSTIIFATLKTASVEARRQTTIRQAITSIIALMVISSPILTLVIPVDVAAGATTFSANNKVDTSSYHTSLPISKTSSPSISIPSSTPTTQAALAPPASFLSNDIVGSNAIYEIVFVTTTTGTIKKIEATFPAGTDISAVGVIERVGIGHGTLTKAGTTVTLNVQTAVSVPGGTYIRLEMVNVKNPQFPFPNYKVTVTTRDPANAIIDGPTQSTAYNIKQIGRNDIADNAITSAKIADGSIGANDLAPTFMISRLLSDDARGNSFGWNPNGIETDFIIIDEAAVLGANAVLINVGDTASNSQCEALGSLSGFFTIRCNTPPPQGSELRYTIINLPLT